MIGQRWTKSASLGGLILWCGLCAGQGQELVYRSISSDNLEAILKELDITYEKAAGKKEGIFSYDFERQERKIRLYNYGGEDLWIEADFTENATLDVVNRWNMRAKFSRAVLVKGDAGASISLEAQMDCTLGCTEGMIRQFVKRFDDEVQVFTKFLK